MRPDTRDGFGKLVSQAVTVPLQRPAVDLCCSVLLWSSIPSRDSHDPLGQGQSTCAQATSHLRVRRRDKKLRERLHCLLLRVLETAKRPALPCLLPLALTCACCTCTNLPPKPGHSLCGARMAQISLGHPTPHCIFCSHGHSPVEGRLKVWGPLRLGRGHRDHPDTKRSQALP